MVDPRTLQNYLKASGFYTGELDGVFGPASHKAARAMLAKYGTATPVKSWTDTRVYVGIQQLFLKGMKIDQNLLVDGLAGPVFRAAILKYDQIAAPTPTKPTVDVTPHNTQWPRQKDVPKFFGAVGKNWVYAQSPYMLYGDYARKIKVSKFQVHRLVKTSVERVLHRTLQYYGADKIRKYNLDIFSGCAVVRKVRGGSGYSMHSWGIAIDWDAAHNELKQHHDKATFAQPRYAPFLDFWEDEGWISLGRERDYDWMHVQAARL